LADSSHTARTSSETAVTTLVASSPGADAVESALSPCRRPHSVAAAKDAWWSALEILFGGAVLVYCTARTWPSCGPGSGVRQTRPGTLPAEETTVSLRLHPRPKLRPVGLGFPALNCGLVLRPGGCSGYFKASGMGMPMRSNASRWVLVGWASIGTVVRVSAKRPGCG
jgi:hypothetical protein